MKMQSVLSILREKDKTRQRLEYLEKHQYKLAQLLMREPEIINEEGVCPSSKDPFNIKNI